MSGEWIYEELENFTELAEKYEFTDSLVNWQEHPSDPVVYTWDRSYTFYSVSTDTDFDSDFHDELMRTSVGDAVGDYRITGNIQTSS